MKRKVFYVSGTRADFGLLRPTLETIVADDRLELGLVVTGMHLSPRFGATVSDIERSGLPIVARVPIDIDSDSGLAMALGAGAMLGAFARLFDEEQPDIVLLLGDRLEMLSAAIAATCTGRAIAHLHGGERSGTIDESLRHAISKLSHYHFAATEGSRQRLLKMGEDDWRIAVVGAPGLVGLDRLEIPSRSALSAQYGLGDGEPFVVVLFHPVVQDADVADQQVGAVLDALAANNLRAVCLLPNADAGNSRIREEILKRAAQDTRLKPVTHLERREYIGLIARCDALVGNSSSGILEAGSFGTPVVNIGERQTARERNPNVMDVGYESEEISAAIAKALTSGRMESANIYFQPNTDARIADLLATARLDRQVIKKLNSY